MPADVLWAAATTAKFRLDFFRFSGTAYTTFTSLIDDDNDPLEMADTDRRLARDGRH